MQQCLPLNGYWSRREKSATCGMFELVFMDGTVFVRNWTCFERCVLDCVLFNVSFLTRWCIFWNQALFIHLLNTMAESPFVNLFWMHLFKAHHLNIFPKLFSCMFKFNSKLLFLLWIVSIFIVTIERRRAANNRDTIILHWINYILQFNIKGSFDKYSCLKQLLWSSGFQIVDEFVCLGAQIRADGDISSAL